MTGDKCTLLGIDIRAAGVVTLGLALSVIVLGVLDERPVRNAGLTLLGRNVQPRWYPAHGAVTECLLDVVYLDDGVPISTWSRLTERNGIWESDFSDVELDDPIPFDVPIATSYAGCLSGLQHRHSSIALHGTIDRQTGRCFVSERISSNHPYTTYRVEALPGRLMRLVVSEKCFWGGYRQCGYLLELSREGDIVLNSQIVPPST